MVDFPTPCPGRFYFCRTGSTRKQGDERLSILSHSAVSARSRRVHGACQHMLLRKEERAPSSRVAINYYRDKAQISADKHTYGPRNSSLPGMVIRP